MILLIMEMAFTLFWKKDGPGGFMSQWFQSKFTVDAQEFTTAEQYMMYRKALLFNDSGVAAKILDTKSPRTVKSLGRQVQGFRESVWKDHREQIVYDGNYAKFSQSEMLKKLLLDTGESILAEASPYDMIWGIGLDPKHKNAKNPVAWPGKNLLGNALMAVRSAIRQEAEN